MLPPTLDTYDTTAVTCSSPPSSEQSAASLPVSPRGTSRTSAMLSPKLSFIFCVSCP